ncbi:hypothetical protein evm_013478 [Chilo suppressalis]|nr:hypothetical protein evm_013478 [Chilo suppressalis]
MGIKLYIKYLIIVVLNLCFFFNNLPFELYFLSAFIASLLSLTETSAKPLDLGNVDLIQCVQCPIPVKNYEIQWSCMVDLNLRPTASECHDERRLILNVL